MKPRVCAGCGAPLPDTSPTGVVTCRFCGLAHDPRHPPRLTATRAPRSDTAAGTRTAVLAGLVIAGSLGLVAAIVAMVATSGPPAPPAVRATAPRPASTPPRPLRVSDLSTPRSGSHALDVAPPPQGYGAVDPVAQIPWALAIAQGWAEDARLERVDVARLRPDGTANVADDPQGSLWYRFISPSRIQDLRTRSRTSALAEGVTELQVRVSQGQPRVLFLPTRAAAMRPRGRRRPIPPRLADRIADPAAAARRPVRRAVPLRLPRTPRR